MPTYIEPTGEKPMEHQLEEELEQNGRRLRRGAGLLLAVPAHVAAERLAHLELKPADVALVRLLLLRDLLAPRLIVSGSEAEREPVAAAQVAGPVAAQRLERLEGPAASLADELPLPRRRHNDAPPALGRPSGARVRRRHGGRRRVRAEGQRQRDGWLLLPRMLHPSSHGVVCGL